MTVMKITPAMGALLLEDGKKLFDENCGKLSDSIGTKVFDALNPDNSETVELTGEEFTEILRSVDKDTRKQIWNMLQRFNPIMSDEIEEKIRELLELDFAFPPDIEVFLDICEREENINITSVDKVLKKASIMRPDFLIRIIDLYSKNIHFSMEMLDHYIGESNTIDCKLLSKILEIAPDGYFNEIEKMKLFIRIKPKAFATHQSELKGLFEQKIADIIFKGKPEKRFAKFSNYIRGVQV